MANSITQNKIKELNWSLIEQIPINENNSPLVSIHKTDKLTPAPVYFQWGLDNAIDKIYLRQEVAERLYRAANLLPEGIGLLVLDGWRSIATQQALREKMRQEIKIDNPEASNEWINNELNKFVADPNRKGMCPPHLTGGSVDVTLFDLNTLTELDMGGDFDEPGAISFTTALEESTDPLLNDAKFNRRLLVNTMQTVGFTNIPTEWWHFDYGNSNWAYFSNSPVAFYGATYKSF